MGGGAEWVREDQLGYCNNPGQNCWNSRGGGEKGGESKVESEERDIIEDIFKR